MGLSEEQTEQLQRDLALMVGRVGKIKHKVCQLESELNQLMQKYKGGIDDT